VERLGAVELGELIGGLAARRAATVAATPAGVKVTRLATCCRVGTAAGVGSSSARASFAGGRLVGGWVASARDSWTTRPPVSR
jgi:hypothetical protein